MRVLGVDPVPRTVENLCEVAPLDQLDTLLAESHFVVIAAPHTPRTEKLFKAATLARMRPGSYLINIGRGIIVDLADLTAALQSHHLAGAALDVCEVEPLPASHPLWQMPNVLITPHVAAASPRVSERHTGVLLENVRRFAHNQPLLNVVNKREWY